MKFQKTTDRRLVLQLTSIGLLTALPVTMIAVNGGRALTAIFRPDSIQDPVEVEPVEQKPGNLGDGVSEFSTSEPLRFGVYDPDGVFAGDTEMKLRHIYVSWTAFEPQQLFDQLSSLEAQGYEVLLTIEPWPQKRIERPLLAAIEAGEYDRFIDDLAGVLNRLNGPVFVSWGHEMDQDLTERYPWSGSDPTQYVKAYRYVVDRIRRQVDTQLHWIWAAVLKEGSLQYWPGDQYADYVGMPIYSFVAWDQATYGFIRDFRTAFDEKRSIVEGLGKPMMITELGVSGSPDFESFWLHQAFLSLQDYRDLAAVVFFYARDTEGAWGSDIETPDWRVHEESIRGLVQWKLH